MDTALSSASPEDGGAIFLEEATSTAYDGQERRTGDRGDRRGGQQIDEPYRRANIVPNTG